MAVALHTSFEESTVRSAAIRHHERFVTLGTSGDEHHGTRIGEFLSHIEKEVVGESVDVLHLPRKV